MTEQNLTDEEKLEIELGEQARLASDSWDGVAPGKATNFGASFRRMIGLLGPSKVAFIFVSLMGWLYPRSWLMARAYTGRGRCAGAGEIQRRFFAVFSAMAARISALNAVSSMRSPSWRSMARRVFPSRLALNSPDGSGSEAPFAKVSFTAAL